MVTINDDLNNPFKIFFINESNKIQKELIIRNNSYYQFGKKKYKSLAELVENNFSLFIHPFVENDNDFLKLKNNYKEIQLIVYKIDNLLEEMANMKQEKKQNLLLETEKNKISNTYSNKFMFGNKYIIKKYLYFII